jgi:hypothetical protein
MKIKNYFGALLMGTMLLTPFVMQADDHHDKRYYDKEHKDYHQWNDHENQAYHKYVEERHVEYRDWNRVRPTQQQEYWHWRHDHPDNTLFKVEIR